MSGKNSQDITWPQAYAPPCQVYPYHRTRKEARDFCRSARKSRTQRCKYCTCRTVVKYMRSRKKGKK